MTSIASTYSHDIEYKYIEIALQEQWPHCIELQAEMQAYTPKSIDQIDDLRRIELARLKALNPNSDDKSLLELIDGQLKSIYEPNFHFASTFNDRFMAKFVTVLLLAHALCEAAINTALAIGLGKQERHDLFALIERSDLREKWLVGPKVFLPSYQLNKSGALHETLKYMIRQRNSFTHLKIELEVDGLKVLDGSRLRRDSLLKEMYWMWRIFSLPYDLMSNLNSQAGDHVFFILIDRGKILPAVAHGAA